MSQSNVYVEIYIENQEKKQELVDVLLGSADTITLDSDELTLEEVHIDDVISFQAITGTLVDCEQELRRWLKIFQPLLTAVSVSGDYGQVSFGLIKNRKVKYSKAIETLMTISKRIETALKIKSSTRKELQSYLKKNSVCATEKFQGVSHIDRCASEHLYSAIEYFIDQGLDPYHQVTHYRTSSRYQSLLAFDFMFEEGYSVVKKLIAAGFDVNTLNENGENLLHHIDTDSLPMCKYLLEQGINVNVVNTRGKTPLMEVIHYFCSTNKPIDLNETPELINELTEIGNLLLKAGASLELFDNKGAGNLLYARHLEAIKNWILSYTPDLKPFQKGVNHDKALISLFRKRPNTVKFYEECLKENVISPFYKPEFVNVLKHPSYPDAPESIKTAILYGSQIIELFCRYDRADLFEVLQGIGFPLLSPCYGQPSGFEPAFSSGCSFEYAKKCKAKNVLAYMEKSEINDFLLNSIQQRLTQWLEQCKNDLGDISIIKSHCSKKFLSNTGQINCASDEDIQVTFTNLVKYASNKHMNHIWGVNLFIGPYEAGIILKNGHFSVIAYEEVYENTLLNLTVNNQ
jgi:hypothetical protein